MFPCRQCGVYFRLSNQRHRHEKTCNGAIGDKLSFCETSSQAVIDFITSDQAAQGRLRMAYDCGCLHEELTRLTHFCGPPENRNILGIESHGAMAKIVHENEFLYEVSSTVLSSIYERNVKITKDPAIRAVLGIDGDGEVLTEPTKRQRASYNTRIRFVIRNGGEYIMPSATTPPHPELDNGVTRRRGEYDGRWWNRRGMW